LIVSELAYVPLAFVFQPRHLTQFGPIAFQAGRLLHHVIYFFAGVGAYGLERGLLKSDGRLAHSWIYVFVIWLQYMLLGVSYMPSRRERSFSPARLS